MSSTKHFLLVLIAATLIFSVAAIFAFAGKEESAQADQQVLLEENLPPEQIQETSTINAGKVDMTHSNQQVILETEYRSGSKPWTPTADQTQEALTAIKEYLHALRYTETSSAYADLEYIKDNFADYTVQFVGFESEDQKKIWCNFMHVSTFSDDEEHERWRKNILRTLDGGKDYWQIEYNTETGEVSKFYINGES